MTGTESVLEKKWRKARDKKRAQRLCLQQTARAVSVLIARNTDSQRSFQESLIVQAAFLIRDHNTARECYWCVSLPPQATSVKRDINAATQSYIRESILPQSDAATTSRHA